MNPRRRALNLLLQHADQGGTENGCGFDYHFYCHAVPADRSWGPATRDRHVIEQHTITPEALHALLASNPEVLLFDVRQPLDLLADSEIIPGAKRISPKEVLENPSLIPQEKDSIVYCTSPSNKTSLRILHRALALHLTRIKLLKGGLDGWKKKGYPVEPYTKPFHLDTGSPDLHDLQSRP